MNRRGLRNETIVIIVVIVVAIILFLILTKVMNGIF